jgi:hypothetical protein
MKIKTKVEMGAIPLLALALMAAPSLAQANAAGNEVSGNSVSVGQAKDDLFAGTEQFAKGASSVTQIDMDPRSLDEVEGHNSARAHNTVLSVVHTYGYDKPGMYNMADVQKYRAKLDSGDWHCSVHTYDGKGDSTDVCERHRTDGLRETAIMTVSPKSLTFIHTIRRHGGPGESELEDLPRVLSGGGLPALAMLEPGMLQLELGLRNMQLPDSAAIQDRVQAQVDAALQTMPKLDSDEIQRRMDKAQQQMEEINRRMKQWKLPDGEANGGAARPEE